jgi:hypothetical protein
VHPATSTSPEPMIALNRVIALIIVQRLSLRLQSSPCAWFTHGALQLLERASSASVRLDSEYLLRT